MVQLGCSEVQVQFVLFYRAISARKVADVVGVLIRNLQLEPQTKILQPLLFQDLTLLTMTTRTNYSEGNAHFSIDSRYRVHEILGKGSYGTVCSAIELGSEHHGEANKIAIKKVTDVFRKEVLLKRSIRELKLMSHFRGHPNVRKP